MRECLRGSFWLFVALLFWLSIAVCLILVWLYAVATGWVNRRFDACFGDW